MVTTMAASEAPSRATVRSPRPVVSTVSTMPASGANTGREECRHARYRTGKVAASVNTSYLDLDRSRSLEAQNVDLLLSIVTVGSGACLGKNAR